MRCPPNPRAIIRLSSCYIALQLFVTCYASSLCSIVNHRSAIVGDRFFFSSGNYTFDDGQTMRNTSLLYWLRLNETIDVSGPIDMSQLGSVDLPSTSLVNNRGGSAGTFFYDHTSLYPYAGMIGPDADGINNSLWSFNTTDDTWNLAQVQGGKISFGTNSEGVYASDPSTGTSFYTGGWVMAFNNTNNGTVKFQSFNSASPQWTFETATTGIQGPNILKGTMVHLRKGQAGVLLAFGGYQTAYPGTRTAQWYWDQRPFSDIFVYDIFSNVWYLQEATGDIPSLRTDFCAGVSVAPDDSSFQVTIHGGWDEFNGRAYDDVYVLSIPSFRWIKISDTHNPDLLGPDSPGRNRPKCDVWNGTQLIVSGGFITVNTGADNWKILNKRCNKTYPPFKVLDTSSYTWRTSFDPNLEYSVPLSVTTIIGGDSSGNATLNTPSTGWSSEDLETIFSKTVPRDTYELVKKGPNVSASTPSPSPSSEPGDINNSLSQGAIAGIAIAVIMGVIIILVSVLVWLDRKHTPIPRKMVETANIIAMTDSQWQKPELEGCHNARHELGISEPRPHEVHSEGISRCELPGSAPSLAELPCAYHPG
ncbi:uncharacterized protein GGS22DRAFT_77219 [Annulohypoxylon maeteangense]|uniref:uncharacterized protein n=1 Tax=Annulohypoxylon maeteangense TaxID=1927788 RepID=UPI002007B7FC|nr:uncharacterized protein GGS22DRAFT_77219 [Annulohypoxylon maeteangense]KAI0880861.1 hypothetical protein GGS22DRAFT_77219 [Annulohypoxylon maeteangense]